MIDVIKWGILGTGNIAGKFATGLKALPDAQLVAVGSRSQSTADAFGDEFDVPERYSSYEGLAGADSVDVVYVSTPHVFHKDNSILCLKAGKAVLCEKPFAINASEVRDIVKVAREQRCFLMEAMWTRFIPATVRLREWLKEGVIGDLRMFQGSFGFRAQWNPESRLLDPALGGGALLDLGVYPISFASMLFGAQPADICSQVLIGETGVDEQSAFVFKYDGGGLASLACGIQAQTPTDGFIMGSEAMIKVHGPFWRSECLSLSVHGKNDTVLNIPHESNGYNYQAAAVMECLRHGKLECGIMPLDESIAILETMDRVRSQWGMKYPSEA